VNQTTFEVARRARWEAFDAALATLGAGGAGAGRAAREWPRRYREIAGDLAIARERAYAPELVAALERRALAGHQALYGARGDAWGAASEFIARGFPALVRRESLTVWIAIGLLFIPLLGLIALLQFAPDFAYQIVGADQLRSYERMYAPGNRAFGPRHEAGSQVMMFGYYIWNNVKIDFQCFAGGLLFGVGSVFFLVYNGIMIGTMAGHLTQVGLVATFWGFVAGHSAWELLGAALSGAAGLKLGWALIAPGRLSRRAALKRANARAIGLLIGAAGMTVIAAFIEAFWSSLGAVGPAVKVAVGAAFWTFLLLYFLFAGRAR
jgi:uncharacterized membrane protein SpoIIM required for sporulation